MSSHLSLFAPKKTRNFTFFSSFYFSLIQSEVYEDRRCACKRKENILLPRHSKISCETTLTQTLVALSRDVTRSNENFESVFDELSMRRPDRKCNRILRNAKMRATFDEYQLVIWERRSGCRAHKQDENRFG